MSKRLDVAMLDQKLVKTRSQARMLICQGDVYVDEKQILKPGHKVSDACKIEIKTRSDFVGRGAYKLKEAVEKFKLDFSNLIVADIGASTGGFTQLCLEYGAKKVYAIDVGRDQLALELRDDQRVVNMEGVNARYPLELDAQIDAFVMDVSFISSKLIIPNLLNHLSDKGFGVVLLKPQFEAGKERIGKQGLVRPEHVDEIVDEYLAWLKAESIKVEGIVDSPVLGKTGNKEFLVHLSKLCRKS